MQLSSLHMLWGLQLFKVDENYKAPKKVNGIVSFTKFGVV